MRVLNFGSINIDHVYRLPHFVRPGETLSSESYSRFGGGKGLNQSIALAHAGAPVVHAGKIGAGDEWLRERLQRSGADVTFVETVDGPSGHAIIQVNRDGENAIILHGGANRRVTSGDGARILEAFGVGDYLLLQNEISAIPDIMLQAAQRGLRIVFNPAPMHADVLAYPLDCVSCFVLNEIEAAGLTGDPDPAESLRALRLRYPHAAVVLTLGDKGALFADECARLQVPALRVKAVDTTAAGDTFIGYFLAETMRGVAAEEALRTACRAAALCVVRPGAADSIPRRDEVAAFEPAG